MSKKEFLERLRASLISLSEKDKEDIISDFEEHFDDALKIGKSEEEICRELGNPEDIGKIYNEEIKNENRESFTKEQESTDNYLNGINEIEIDSYSYDVRVLFENREDVFQESDDDMFFNTIEGNKLFISLKHVHRTQARFNFFNFSFNGGRINVHIPVKFKGKLAVRSGSGDVEIVNDCNINELDIHAASGDIKCSGINAANVNLRSESGDIAAGKVTSQYADIYSVSGDVTAYDASGNINMKSISGDVRLDVQELNGDINVSMISGDGSIKLPKNSSFMFYFKTVSGDISCNLPFQRSGGYVGGQYRGIVGDGKYQVKVTSTSGDLRVVY